LLVKNHGPEGEKKKTAKKKKAQKKQEKYTFWWGVWGGEKRLHVNWNPSGEKGIGEKPQGKENLNFSTVWSTFFFLAHAFWNPTGGLKP